MKHTTDAHSVVLNCCCEEIHSSMNMLPAFVIWAHVHVHVLSPVLLACNPSIQTIIVTALFATSLCMPNRWLSVPKMSYWLSTEQEYVVFFSDTFFCLCIYRLRCIIFLLYMLVEKINTNANWALASPFTCDVDWLTWTGFLTKWILAVYQLSFGGITQFGC